MAATNRPLRERVRDQTFRQDLFYRLNVVRLALPPLRERAGDIPLLVDTFLHELSAQHGRSCPAVEPDLLAKMATLSWPGNVRELRNCVETMLLTSSADRLTAHDLPVELSGARETRPGEDGRPLPLCMRTIAEVERELIANTLRELRGNRARAAEVLGISARTLYRRIKELDLS